MILFHLIGESSVGLDIDLFINFFFRLYHSQESESFRFEVFANNTNYVQN